MIFLQLMLKWLGLALFLLALFSALPAIYIYYALNFGSCQSGGEHCGSHIATLYASGIGIVGFSVSGLAAAIIRRGFQQQQDQNRDD